ncbi:MAG TPA: arginase family protein [Chthoniobacterales bacterium]|jgi:hypothetical protein
MMPGAAHLDLDDAWREEPLQLPIINAKKWGPVLRFSAPARVVENFYREFEKQLPPFILYGSGDFHYLTALWIRAIAAGPARTEPITVISFDNHPDWDIRPPKWACGGWVNRALELPHVEKVSVWGCGNFECWWPHNIFGNRRAERQGRLEVHPWADGRSTFDRNRRGAILRENWQDHFQRFIQTISGTAVYITVDMDCFVEAEAVTNWENGRFTTADLAWSLQEVRKHCRVIGGDICGAYSEPQYARWKQRFASEFDHPKLSRPSASEIREINFRCLTKIWPVLVSKPDNAV